MPVPPALRGREGEVLCRAVDASYNVQPERPASVWNIRGLNCTAWHTRTLRFAQ